MARTIEIEAHGDIESPVLRRMCEDVVGNIAEKVMSAVTEEITGIFEALEGALEEALGESKGGAE